MSTIDLRTPWTIAGTAPRPPANTRGDGAVGCQVLDAAGRVVAKTDTHRAPLIQRAPTMRDALETILERLTDGRREMTRDSMEENADLIRATLRGLPE